MPPFPLFPAPLPATLKFDNGAKSVEATEKAREKQEAAEAEERSSRGSRKVESLLPFRLLGNLSRGRPGCGGAGAGAEKII